MASQAQIKANRQNAKKSTGPKTAEGKAAVSQNALKHGLFADSVVTGETEAEYAAFHGELLAELDPRGVMELLLAERVVSLWWRLRRAERMQNQAIEDKIGRFVTNKPSRSSREYYLLDQGNRPGDPGFDLDDLPLGRIANDDFANSRLLDRMLLYERRIESSLNRAMKELKSFQTIRRIEYQEAVEQQSAPNEALAKRGTDLKPVENMARMAMPRENHGDLKKQTQSFDSAQDKFDCSAFSSGVLTDGVQRAASIDLKKQSQFPTDDIVTSLYASDGYGDIPAGETGENKAKKACSFGKLRTGSEQSQMGQISTCGLSDEAGKGGKSASAATG
jgi:hypothetical protein